MVVTKGHRAPGSSRRGQEDSHGSGCQVVKRVSVTKKRRQGLCHKLRSGSEFKDFLRCPGNVPFAWKRCLINETQATARCGVGLDTGDHL